MRPALTAAAVSLALLAACGMPLAGTDIRVIGANLSYANGEYGRATADYLSALDGVSAAAAATVLYDLGNVYAALGEAAAARDTMRKALDGAKAGRELLFRAWFNLGALEYEQNRFEEAARCFAQALRRKPGDIDAKVNLELALRKAQAGAAQSAAPASARRMDRRTSEILDLARQKEARSWKSAPPTRGADKGDDW